jgi:hypothetical protein
MGEISVTYAEASEGDLVAPRESLRRVPGFICFFN